MKVTWEKSNILILDFEGTVKSGIREAGFVLVKDGEVNHLKEISKCTHNHTIEDLVVNYFRSKKLEQVDVFVSHSASIEHNLLKNIMPYRAQIFETKGKNFYWDPWIDTVQIYKTLYPSEKKFDLKSLAKRFIDDEIIEDITIKYCIKEKRSFHHSLFDAIICYLLLKRITEIIDLNKLLLRFDSGR
jgi:DNA polymerase III epsilon subunit-like protein